MFLAYLEEISPKFSMHTYNLLTNNCNNFTDTCSEFLTGSKIPDYITGLPEHALNSPLGAQLRPMI